MKTIKLIRFYYGDFVQAQWVRIRAERSCIESTSKNYEVLVHEKILQFKKDKFNNYDYSKDNINIELISRNSFSSLLKASRSEVLKNSPDIVHCHSWIATLIVCLSVLFIKNKPKVIYEVHGATAFESLYRHNKSIMGFIRFLIIYFLESLASILADKLFLVSFEIKKYYPVYSLKPSFVISRELSDFNNLSNNITINQTFLNFIHEAKEKNLPVLVYSGGFSKWQMPQETLKLMKILSSNNLAKCVIFSNQIGEFKKYISDMENWYFDSVNSNELIAYLKLCDIGVLLREDIVLNRVASPTKLYEYLQAELVILTTKGAAEAKLACSEHNYLELNLDDFLFGNWNLSDFYSDMISILKSNKMKDLSFGVKKSNNYSIISNLYDI